MSPRRRAVVVIAIVSGSISSSFSGRAGGAMGFAFATQIVKSPADGCAAAAVVAQPQNGGQEGPTTSCSGAAALLAEGGQLAGLKGLPRRKDGVS
jgi:hypothetical protein